MKASDVYIDKVIRSTIAVLVQSSYRCVFTNRNEIDGKC